MSWDITLATREGAYLNVEHFQEGGTYALGGISESDLNVTYNYSPHYYKHLGLEDGLRGIHGMTAEEALPHLKQGVDALPDEPGDDYWAPTEGNAGHALAILYKWAVQACASDEEYVFDVA